MRVNCFCCGHALTPGPAGIMHGRLLCADCAEEHRTEATATMLDEPGTFQGHPIARQPADGFVSEGVLADVAERRRTRLAERAAMQTLADQFLPGTKIQPEWEFFMAAPVKTTAHFAITLRAIILRLRDEHYPEHPV